MSSILDDPGLLRVITVKDAASILRCKFTKLHILLKKGEIRSYKDGGSRRIYLHSVLQYRDDQAAKGVSLKPAFSPNAKAAAQREAKAKVA
jgi:excisionase family DNA binding protein